LRRKALRGVAQGSWAILALTSTGPTPNRAVKHGTFILTGRCRQRGKRSLNSVLEVLCGTWREKPAKASSIAAMKGNDHPSETQLTERVVHEGSIVLSLREWSVTMFSSHPRKWQSVSYESSSGALAKDKRKYWPKAISRWRSGG